MKNPHTRAEWQEAVDAAKAFLLLDSARKYGLVTGGPVVDVVRCEELLAMGRRLTILPDARCAERLAAELKR